MPWSIVQKLWIRIFISCMQSFIKLGPWSSHSRRWEATNKWGSEFHLGDVWLWDAQDRWETRAFPRYYLDLSASLYIGKHVSRLPSGVICTSLNFFRTQPNPPSAHLSARMFIKRKPKRYTTTLERVQNLIGLTVIIVSSKLTFRLDK